MRNRPRHCGYVLVMLLLLLAIVSTTVAAVGRRSLDRVLDVERAQSVLQQRWIEVTARHTLLSRAETVLRDVEAVSRSPQVFTEIELELGRIGVRLVVADEQAMVNANRLYDLGGLRGTDRHLRALVATTGSITHPPVVEIKPKIVSGTGGRAAILDGYAALFRDTDPQMLLGTARRPGSALAVTCWGDGWLNYRRASEPALAAICDGVLNQSEVRELIEIRIERPNLAVHELIETMQLSGRQSNQLERLLTDQSGCHSLWIVTDDGRRMRYTYLVDTANASSSVTAAGGREWTW